MKGQDSDILDLYDVHVKKEPDSNLIGPSDSYGSNITQKDSVVKPLTQRTQANGMYDPELNVIVLGRNFNTTTLPHEMAHFWLENPISVQILCKLCAKTWFFVVFYSTNWSFGNRTHKQKTAEIRGFSGGDTGTRTLDPMIKSHLLYQLSYVPKTGPRKGEPWVLFLWYAGNFDTYQNKNQEKIQKFVFYFFTLGTAGADGVKCCCRFRAAIESESNQSKIRDIIALIYLAEICRRR